MTFRQPNHKPRQAAGFTLVELLLAITLMSILLGLTYTGLRAATRSTERGEIMLAVGGEVRAAHQFVRKQLNQMLPLAFSVTEDVNAERIVFMGDRRSIQYVAPMPGYLGTGGPQVQLLELASGDDGSVLQFSHALLQSFEEQYLFEREPIILLENIDSADFEFMGRDEQGELTGWMPSWDQPQMLPVAVRLNLEFNEETQMLWPEMLAGVRVDESALQIGGGQRTLKQTYQDMLYKKRGTK